MSAKIIQAIGLLIVMVAAVVFFSAYVMFQDGGDEQATSQFALTSLLSGIGGIAMFMIGRVIDWLKKP